MSKSKVLVGLVSLEASLLALQTAAFLLCVHTEFLVCGCLLYLLCVQISSSYKDTSRTRLGFTLKTSFSLNHL